MGVRRRGQGIAREDRGLLVGRRVAFGGGHDHFLLQGGAAAFALPVHRGGEAGVVHRQAALARQQLGHVEGEAVGVVEFERVRPGNRPAGRRRGRGKALEPAIEGVPEGLLLGADHPADQIALGDQLRKDRAQRGGHGGNQLLEKAGRQAELLAVEDPPAEDPPDHVIASLVAGQDAVGHGAGNAARVVRQDAEGDVGHFLLAQSLAPGGDSAAIGLPGEGGDLRKERRKHVGLVVRGFGREILEAPRRRLDAGDTLKAHAGVDVAGGQGRKGAVLVGVELDEDVVPDLDAARGCHC